MAAALKIVIDIPGLLMLAGMLTALLTAVLGLLFPIGLDIALKLRGSCLAFDLKVKALGRLRVFGITRYIAYDGTNGLILCGGDINKFGSAVLSKKSKKNKRKRRKLFKLFKRLLPSFINSVTVKSIEAEGCIGGAEAADKTALAYGALHAAFAGLQAALPMAAVDFNIKADYSQRSVSCDFKCIALFRLGKFIIKAVKIYLHYQ